MGVVMFNGDQQCLIESVLDQARRSDSSVQADFDCKQANHPGQEHRECAGRRRHCPLGSHWS
jgi:hypothetical protein